MVNDNIMMQCLASYWILCTVYCVLYTARFLVERGAKNNLLEDGTPNLQRAILGCHLITHLMSKLHMMGTLHVSD